MNLRAGAAGDGDKRKGDQGEPPLSSSHSSGGLENLSSPAETFRTGTGMSAEEPGLLLVPSTCFSSSSAILVDAENTAKRQNQNNGMTAMLPKNQNIYRFQKSTGFKIMTGS